MVQINMKLKKTDKDVITVIEIVDGKSRLHHDERLRKAYVENKRPPIVYKNHNWVLFRETKDGALQFNANDIRDELYGEKT